MATTVNTIFTKIIAQTNRAGQHSLTSNTVQPPSPSPCLQVGRSKFAWAEARVCSEGRNTGQEAGGPRTGTGKGAHPEPQLRAECGGIRGHIKPRRPLGTWPKTPKKCFGPYPSTLPSPLPSAAILASRGPVNTGDTSTNDRTSSGGQGDSSCPGQGLAGTGSDTCPLPPQSL